MTFWDFIYFYAFSLKKKNNNNNTFSQTQFPDITFTVLLLTRIMHFSDNVHTKYRDKLPHHKTAYLYQKPRCIYSTL